MNKRTLQYAVLFPTENPAYMRKNYPSHLYSTKEEILTELAGEYTEDATFTPIVLAGVKYLHKFTKPTNPPTTLYVVEFKE